MIPIPAFLLSPKLWLAAGIALSIFCGGWAVRDATANSQIAGLKLEHSQAIAKAEKAARTAIEDARRREGELLDKTKGIVDDARQTIQALERNIGAADAVSRSMLDAASRAAGRCSPRANPAAAGRSPGAELPSSMSDGDRFLRVLGELDGAAGAYAADSGRARAARAACEKAYKAVMEASNQ